MIFLNLLAAAIIVATPSSVSTPSAAQEILNRVTDQITQIANQLKKVYIGKIKTIGTVSIVITGSDGDQTITTNEATSYYKIRSGNRVEINFKGLKVGDELAALGTIDQNNLEMTARQIIVKVHRYNLVGTVELNDKNVITIKEFSGPSTRVDLSDTPILKKNLGTIFSPAKLTDFKVGTVVCVIAYSDPTSPDLLGLKADILNL